MTIPIVKIANKSDQTTVIDALKLAFVADHATLGMARNSEISFKLFYLCQGIWRKRI